MKLSDEIKYSINKSILCWLATSSLENIPNVSPKEVFNYYDDETIIIANIASPESKKNILQNNNVSLSFIDILVQKGFQVKGVAEIIPNKHPEFSNLEKELLKITNGKYPFSSIFKITITSTKPIIAPSYHFYPEITEQERIVEAKKNYRLNS